MTKQSIGTHELKRKTEFLWTFDCIAHLYGALYKVF